MSLTTSVGSVTPEIVVVENGQATVEIALSAAEGIVQLSASGGGVSGAITIDINALHGLPGDPVESAVGAIPNLEYTPREEDYRVDPTLGGITTSFNTVLVMFEPGATIAQVNDLLADLAVRIVGGIPTATTGVLVLRLNSLTHEDLAGVLVSLKTNPAVKLAVQDSRLEAAMVPDSNNGLNPPNWVWTGFPATGNWGLEISRVPQAWNLLEALSKRGNTTVTTGVYDVGFFDHEDLEYGSDHSTFITDDHGTHVAGTIAAISTNHKGVDGVTPFANLAVYAPFFLVMAAQLQGFKVLTDDGARVINFSIEYKWTSNPAEDPSVVSFVSDNGELVKAFVDDLRVVNEPPLIVACAGNHSRGQSPPFDARYTSGVSWAGLVLGSDHVIVVEAVQLTNGVLSQTKRAVFSDIGGDVSAPGVGILSTVGEKDYQLMQGCSMAAPHVTGLASYLITIDPSLTNVELKDLIISNAIPITDQTDAPADRMDAFSSALDIDSIRGNATVLKMLLDIDDGTRDGNLRIRPGTSIDFILEDADGDGGIGDGSVDMADFRRWRDWLHRAAGTPEALFNGSAEHPKHDVNGNGKVEAAAFEGIGPRGDFGIIALVWWWRSL